VARREKRTCPRSRPDIQNSMDFLLLNRCEIQSTFKASDHQVMKYIESLRLPLCKKEDKQWISVEYNRLSLTSSLGKR
jgi:hypothetical protein